MPKDYKDSPASRGDSKLSHPLLLGMIIGLLLGIVISLAVALWLNRLANPFVEKGKAVEPTPKIAPAQPPPPPERRQGRGGSGQGREGRRGCEAQSAARERRGAPALRVLPDPPRRQGHRPKPARRRRPRRPRPRRPSAAPRPGSSPATPKPHSGDSYWLQAGAFSEEKEADNLRAKIALTGLEASVHSVATADKGKLYRVRLGPYQSLDDANRIKAALSQNGVGAAIIKINEEPKNP